MNVVLALVGAYLLGSIPWAYLAGRFKGVDLRKFGSGNLGTTNVLRLLGVPAALAVYALDALKGALPVLLFPGWFGFRERGLWAVLCGIAAILGHVRPIFLMWKGGGKGVATASGVFGALAPAAIGITIVVWFVTLLISGYMSLASLMGAAVLPIAILMIAGARSPVFAVSIVVAAFVFWTHRANIGRLRRGEEPRFGRKAPPPPQAPSTPEAP